MKKSDPQWHTYASYTSKQTGKFLDLPPYAEMVAGGFEIAFILEQKHFKEIDGIGDIIDGIVDATNKRFGGNGVTVERIGKPGKFTAKFDSAIENKKDYTYKY